MAQVEDLREVMQRQVVGVPHTWVHLFQWLDTFVVTFHDHKPTYVRAYKVKSRV